MTASEVLAAASAAAAETGCEPYASDAGRDLTLLNLACAELWGLNNSVRESKGMDRLPYTDDVRVCSESDELPAESELYPALVYFTAAALIMPDAPEYSDRMREIGVSAAESLRRSLPPSAGGIGNVYGY